MYVGSATTVVLLRNQVSYAVLMVAVAISVGNRATGTAKDIRVTAGVYSQVLSLFYLSLLLTVRLTKRSLLPTPSIIILIFAYMHVVSTLVAQACKNYVLNNIMSVHASLRQLEVGVGVDQLRAYGAAVDFWKAKKLTDFELKRPNNAVAVAEAAMVHMVCNRNDPEMWEQNVLKKVRFWIINVPVAITVLVQTVLLYTTKRTQQADPLWERVMSTIVACMLLMFALFLFVENNRNKQLLNTNRGETIKKHNLYTWLKHKITGQMPLYAAPVSNRSHNVHEHLEFIAI